MGVENSALAKRFLEMLRQHEGKQRESPSEQATIPGNVPHPISEIENYDGIWSRDNLADQITKESQTTAINKDTPKL